MQNVLRQRCIENSIRGLIMLWIEGRIQTTSEGVEPVLGLLMGCNVHYTQVEDDNALEQFLAESAWDYHDVKCQRDYADVIFYVESEEQFAQVKCNLQSLANIVPEIDFGTLKISCKTVNDQDWLHEWKKTYKPFFIGEVAVRPYWEDFNEEAKAIFTIDPGGVFGTGLHESTQMCVLELQKLNLNKAEVLDIGCGSGILSIIALLLGAESVFACDIDPAAEVCVVKNSELNQINPKRYCVRTGNFLENESLRQGKYNVVLANIVADVIVGLASKVKDVMVAEGVFIMSGIITERLTDVYKALFENGFSIICEREMNGWHCLVATHA
jgi:ribosomal protein L11 methyltransferase